MGQLLFKKVFWAAIRGGTKRTTIRRWTAPRVRPGQRAWTPGVGWLAIESVEAIDRLDDLTDADARADGFASATAMRAALKTIYPRAAGDGRAWFGVAFRWEDVVGSDHAKEEDDDRAAVPGRGNRRKGAGAAGAMRAASNKGSRAGDAKSRNAARAIAAALKDAIARQAAGCSTSSPPLSEPKPASGPQSLAPSRPPSPPDAISCARPSSGSTAALASRRQSNRRKSPRASRVARAPRVARGSGPRLVE